MSLMEITISVVVALGLSAIMAGIYYLGALFG